MNDRIQLIIDYFGLNPNTFAQEIGVNRSTLSHVLNGRNKPSVDFAQKILMRYSEISARWLMTGFGTMISSKNENTAFFQDIDTSHRSVKKIVVFYDDNKFEEFNKGE